MQLKMRFEWRLDSRPNTLPQYLLVALRALATYWQECRVGLILYFSVLCYVHGRGQRMLA
jgi:hypothetical protein